MLFSHLKLSMFRFLTILALFAMMLGMTPVRPAYADTIVVTNTNDSGPGSLRQAIFDATFEAGPTFGDTIKFDPSLAGQTITLTTQLSVNQELTIDGSGLNPPVALSGGNASRIMQITFFGNVTIFNLIFTQGVSSDDGGAVEVMHSADLTLANCIFSQNQAGGSGGAIEAVANSHLTISNSTFNQNQANGSGGAISTSGNVSTTIVNSTFTDNSAGGNGGALSGGNLVLIDSTLSRNRAGEDGGAIYSYWLNIKNTTIDQNQATFAGGAIALEGVNNSLISNSTVFENQAGDTGGAIFAQGNVSIDVVNSTFAGNNAPEGSELSLRGVVLMGLYNTILACVPGNTGCIYNIFGAVGTSNSIIETGTLASFGLSELADNGGFTQTIALLPGSPLIDAGSDSICADPSVDNLDQRGVARPEGRHCDIGAYEFQPIVRYVKQDATGTNDGSSWSNAFTDLQTALSAVSPDEELWVAAGTYKPTLGTDRTISFNLKNDVTIYGGFAGTETLLSERNPEVNVTILSGDIGVEEDSSDNSYHVVVASDTNHSAILDGFTITAGNANDPASSQYYFGGGMYINKGSPRLNALTFTDNHAGFGAGIYASHTEGGDVTIDLILTNVVFKDNTASVEGGGMATRFLPDLSSARFRLSLTDVIFGNDTAVRTGGGMINNGGELELVNVSFSRNTAAGGGGLSNLPFKPSKLTTVTFNNNSATDGGGGMLIGSSGPVLSTLTNVTFSNNSTDMSGGGIANAGYSDLLLTNVTFSDNTAGMNGGGITNGGVLGIESGGTVNLINTTFNSNAANSNGGAIYNESGNINIHNSILYGDTGVEIANNSGTSVVTHSIVQGGYAGAGNLDEDPLLGPLQDNGGFTQTMALGAGSPAINGADDTICPATDQRGVKRPQGSHCDIGAYEYDGLVSTVDVIIGSSEVDSYVLSPHESERRSYVGVNGGPMKVVNTDDFSILAAERVIYKVKGVQTSFSEMMGLPENQLDKTYWFPWYNNVGLDTQLRIANVTNNPATVQVTIDGMAMTPLNLAAGESTRVSYLGMNSGPVKIESDQDIVVAERAIYKVNSVHTSFSEMMALPENQLDKTYWLPRYNNVDLDTQLRIANVTDQQATVTVTIGGVQQTPFSLAAGESTRVSYSGVNNGPVKIESTQNIVAAERVIYKVKGIQTSFSEMMALPDSQLDTVYWLPWYNNVDLDTQLRFGNVSDQTATVRVYIGGQEMVGSPFTLQPGESTRQSFPNINNGHMKITSNVPIVVAERVIYKVKGIETSFSEMMALPNALLDATFWFPWYNNVDLDTQLRFGVP